MSLRNTTIVGACLAMLLTIGLWQSGSDAVARQNDPPTPILANELPQDPVAQPVAHRTVGRNLHGELRQAARKLKQTDDADEKEKITAELNTLLSEYFDNDIELREQELETVRKRLEDLQAKIDKRKAMKMEIVDLQLRTVINEAEGLGFFSSGTANGTTTGANELFRRHRQFAPADTPPPGPSRR